MPSDNVLVKFLEHLSSPPLVFAIGVICILAFLAAKSIPVFREISLKRIEIEELREKRAAEERRLEDQRDRSRTEVIAKQNEIMESLVRATDGQAIQMAGLIASLEESKNRSRAIGDTIEDTNSKVSEIHTMIVKARHS